MWPDARKSTSRIYCELKCDGDEGVRQGVAGAAGGEWQMEIKMPQIWSVAPVETLFFVRAARRLFYALLVSLSLYLFDKI